MVGRVFNRVVIPLLILVLCVAAWLFPFPGVATEDARYLLSAISEGMLTLAGFVFVVFTFAYERRTTGVGGGRWGPRIITLTNPRMIMVETCSNAMLAAGGCWVLLRVLGSLDPELQSKLTWVVTILAGLVIIRAQLFLFDFVPRLRSIVTPGGEKQPE